MTVVHIIYAVRAINFVLASIIFAILVFRGRMYLKNMDTSRRWGYISFTLYALATAEFSVETLHDHAVVGPRSFFFLAANLATFYALWKHKQMFADDRQMVDRVFWNIFRRQKKDDDTLR